MFLWIKTPALELKEPYVCVCVSVCVCVCVCGLKEPCVCLCVCDLCEATNNCNLFINIILLIFCH